jgi:hypothetical protein
MKGRDPRAVVLGGGEEAHRHAHRVGRRVGDAHGDLHLGVEVGFEAQRLRGGELLGGDAARRTALEERLEEREVLLGDRDEQPVVVLERTGADPLEDPVLLDALDRGLAVADGIAAPAVQQPVMAPRRSRGQLAALDEGGAQAAQREVVRECGSGTASADDEDVRVVSRQVHRVRRVRRLSERRRACRRLHRCRTRAAIRGNHGSRGDSEERPEPIPYFARSHRAPLRRMLWTPSPRRRRDLPRAAVDEFPDRRMSGCLLAVMALLGPALPAAHAATGRRRLRACTAARDGTLRVELSGAVDEALELTTGRRCAHAGTAASALALRGTTVTPSAG